MVPTGLTQTYGLKKKESKKQQTTKHKETKVNTERKINNNKQKQQTHKHTQTNHKTQTKIAYVHLGNGMQTTKMVITNNAKPPHNIHKTTYNLEASKMKRCSLHRAGCKLHRAILTHENYTVQTAPLTVQFALWPPD